MFLYFSVSLSNLELMAEFTLPYIKFVVDTEGINKAHDSKSITVNNVRHIECTNYVTSDCEEVL
jgi:hypothetical protein